MKRWFTYLAVVYLATIAPALIAGAAPKYAERISSLIEPAKLATLGTRGANPRVQKYIAQLADARTSGANVTNIVNDAVSMAGMKGDGGKLTTDVMLRNLMIAERLGCLNEAGLKEMRQGKAATVTRGPYKGDQLSVDHIIPRAVVPELDNVIANLELMPMRMNAGKNDKVGERQLDLGKKFFEAGLLSKAGLKKLQNHVRSDAQHPFNDRRTHVSR